ncbi:DUF4145 domain-containing protein [Phorcysia thermohydrogeniphila]|uniref:Uncharacterized protein DUF4145 n=1 Tax=Phorcysia thermohydrogeniphila TaxID=936138 RepID=A0A4R1GJP5_9BACT|nr:DUF4145 domain-containing protein [Phorcysia thermohydrogeniphila]TCK04492.1 uncharacterized protein DUF4145 [Phorcysia thermohydrogeniphila]
MERCFIPPEFKKSAFHCPHCGVYSRQNWYYCTPSHVVVLSSLYQDLQENLWVSHCEHCKNYAIWYKGKILYPGSSIAPVPAKDMPEDVKEDFNEARNIVNASPRAAAALLRLALQKLMIHLGEKGKNLNDDIANLVKRGLPRKIQQALDIVRVIGNNAVHPGEIDLRDDEETALALFELINMIVEVMITQPRKIEELYGKLPERARLAIEKRDSSGKEKK